MVLGADVVLREEAGRRVPVFSAKSMSILMLSISWRWRDWKIIFGICGSFLQAQSADDCLRCIRFVFLLLTCKVFIAYQHLAQVHVLLQVHAEVFLVNEDEAAGFRLVD